MPQMTPIRNISREQLKPSAPHHPNQLKMPQMAPIFVNKIDQSSTVTRNKSLMSNNRPTQPSPIGKPPPHIHSQAPPITPQPQVEYGMLVITIIKGINLKTGQGVFGPADPFVKIKVGNNEATTNPHVNGGRNAVSDEAIYCFAQLLVVFITNEIPLPQSNTNGSNSSSSR